MTHRQAGQRRLLVVHMHILCCCSARLNRVVQAVCSALDYTHDHHANSRDCVFAAACHGQLSRRHRFHRCLSAWRTSIPSRAELTAKRVALNARDLDEAAQWIARQAQVVSGCQPRTPRRTDDSLDANLRRLQDDFWLGAQARRDARGLHVSSPSVNRIQPTAIEHATPTSAIQPPSAAEIVAPRLNSMPTARVSIGACRNLEAVHQTPSRGKS